MRNQLAAYTAALNRYDLDAVKEMFAENAIYISPGINSVIHGRDAIITAFRAYFADHPNQVNVDKNVRLINPTNIQSDWSLTATNLRTGKSVSRKGLQVITFNDKQQIALIQVLDF